MAAPLGNKNAAGNGGNERGRKSAYQERADATLLNQVFFGEITAQEALDKIESGRYSISDRFIHLALSGNEKILVAMFNKLFPDSHLFEHSFKRKQLTPEEIEEARRKIIEAFRKSEELEWRPRQLATPMKTKKKAKK